MTDLTVKVPKHWDSLLDLLTVQFHTCPISSSLRKDSISYSSLDLTELAEPAWEFKDSIKHKFLKGPYLSPDKNFNEHTKIIFPQKVFAFIQKKFKEMVSILLSSSVSIGIQMMRMLSCVNKGTIGRGGSFVTEAQLASHIT